MLYRVLLVLLFSFPLYADSRNDSNREEVKKIQLVLKQRGYDPGPVDGIAGPSTLRAVRKYQKASRLPATGKLDTRTIELLRKEAALGPPAAPTGLRVTEIKAE